MASKTKTDIVTPSADPATEALSGASAAWNAKAAEAQAVMASERYWGQYESAERRSIGLFFNRPSGTENWHYIRAGLRGHKRAEELAWRLRRMGYVDAAPDVKMWGFESDGDRGIYMCCPPQVRQRILTDKLRARKARQESLQREFGQKMSGWDVQGGERTLTREQVADRFDSR